MQYSLQVFEDEHHHKIRTTTINGDIWFYALDICAALDLQNPRDSISRLEDDERRTVGSADTSVLASRTNPQIISESGLYSLIFQSRKPEAKRFRKWVTSDVLPAIRKTGGFGLVVTKTPAFVRRFNDNWDRTEKGYFSIISELYIRFSGRLEHVGHVFADKAPDGTELRPDVSVGKTFPRWLKKNYPLKADYYKMYSHIFLPSRLCVDARQYRNDMLPIFIEFIDDEWIPNCAPKYLETRDRKALAYLPKLLPPPKT